jgi:DNA-binding CsgD family transcriptional regulator
MRRLTYLRAWVTRLRTSELEAVLAFVGESHAVDGPEPFAAEQLDGLAKLVPATVAYEEVDLSRRILLAKVWSTGDRPPARRSDPARSSELHELADGHWAGMRASPTAVHRWRTGALGTLKWSDFLSRRERASYAAEFDQQGVVDQASVWLTPSLVHKASIVFESDRRDFSERDRLLVDLLRPHLAGLYRAAGVRRLLAGALAGLEADPDSDDRGVVLRRRDGGLELVSASARRLLDGYFAERGGGLPTALEDWLQAEARRPDRSRSASSRFTVVQGGRRLVVDAVGSDLSTLLLAEEPAPAVPLTAREWDVLRCIAAGNSNAEIARLLWIAPGTVRKHLEHIYGKLGVRSRTAAVARVRPQLADTPRPTSP